MAGYTVPGKSAGNLTPCPADCGEPVSAIALGYEATRALTDRRISGAIFLANPHAKSLHGNNLARLGDQLRCHLRPPLLPPLSPLCGLGRNS